MMEVRGSPALSAFRINKLLQALSGCQPRGPYILYAEYVHFADL